MIDIIKLGLKDIVHNIKIYIVLIVSIMTITIIFVSSTLSISYSTHDEQDKRLRDSYYVAVTSNDMTKNKQLLTDYFEFINKNGSAVLFSSELSEESGINTVITIGNSSLIDQSLKQENKTHGYVISDNSNQLDKMEYRGKEVELSAIDQLTYHEMMKEEIFQEVIVETPAIIICLSPEENVMDWIDARDGLALKQLFENSIFDKNIEQYEQQLFDFFEDSFVTLSKNEANNEESRFIFSYIYPFILITSLCVFISFWLFYRYYLKKMYREYTIHMLYGAQKKDILLRNSIAMALILVICYLLFFRMKQGEISNVVNFGYLFITIFVLLLEFVTIIEVNRNDKLNSMRGVNK